MGSRRLLYGLIPVVQDRIVLRAVVVLICRLLRSDNGDVRVSAVGVTIEEGTCLRVNEGVARRRQRIVARNLRWYGERPFIQ